MQRQFQPRECMHKVASPVILKWFRKPAIVLCALWRKSTNDREAKTETTNSREEKLGTFCMWLPEQNLKLVSVFQRSMQKL
jgi:hypothetical protein